jgi:hypothetical protein
MSMVDVCTCREGLHGRLESLASFNRHVAHDLRGPLVTVSCAAEQARKALGRGDSSMANQLLEVIGLRADGLRQLVTELMELAQADAPLHRRPVDLNVVAAAALDEVRLGPHGLSHAVVQLERLPMVHGSAALLQQVFVNLMGNAMKFSRTCDRPQVRIGEALLQGRRTIFVRDNGVGFSNHQASQLFQPFSRLHGAAYVGHGIGLSFVRRVVENHGGEVWAEPVEPRGAAFHFTLGGLE